MRYLVFLICYALPCLARDGCAWRLAEQLSLFILARLTSHSKRFNLLYLAYLLACLLACLLTLLSLRALLGLPCFGWFAKTALGSLARSRSSLRHMYHVWLLDLLTLRLAGSLTREARFARTDRT